MDYREVGRAVAFAKAASTAKALRHVMGLMRKGQRGAGQALKRKLTGQASQRVGAASLASPQKFTRKLMALRDLSSRLGQIV